MMKAETGDRGALPYRISPGFTLHAEGRWLTGGAVVIYDSVLVEEHAVPKSEWTILALLIEAAQRAEEIGHRAAAFVPAARLASELSRRTGVGGGEPQNIHRAMSKLRDRLTGGAASQVASLKGLQWSREVVESHVTLGTGSVFRPRHSLWYCSMNGIAETRSDRRVWS